MGIGQAEQGHYGSDRLTPNPPNDTLSGAGMSRQSFKGEYVEQLPSILKMTPYFRPVVWGGDRLATAFGKPIPSQDIGESFEVSAVPEMESAVAAGPLAGKTVQDLTKTYGPDFLGADVHRRYEGEFPLLIKLLDANDDLSIQVHPDDIYAREKQLGNFGKMEAWYVLRSDDGRVASGLKAGIDKQALVAAVESGKVEDAVEFHPVSEGDIVYLRPGSVHALCRGVMVYEVQQSSSITFRLYDYKRPDADGNLRELHIDQSLDVINFGDPAIVPAPVSGTTAVESEHFILEQFTIEATHQHEARDSFCCLTVIAGSAEVGSDDVSAHLELAETVVVPANRAFKVNPLEPTTYLISSVPT
jgi:mannose-6-phosphate isomerase